MAAKSILLVDNYDSFTYNLVHYLEADAAVHVTVCTNDAIPFSELSNYSHLVLSPGPGLPEESGDLMKVIEACKFSHSILGVCLGHQALGLSFGGRLKNLDTVWHGRKMPIYATSNPDPLLAGFSFPLWVGRYHSWVVDNQHVPNELLVTTVDEAGEIMSMRHTHLPITSVQYHPESIMTEHGLAFIQRWVHQNS